MKKNVEGQAMCELTQQEIDGVAGGTTVIDTAIDGVVTTANRFIKWFNDTM